MESKTPKKNNKKRKKVVYLPDDGHTIYSMDGLSPQKNKANTKEKLPKEDRHAMIKAAFAVYGPIFLGVILCFAATMILIYFWLK